jgi:hypothetical protein
VCSSKELLHIQMPINILLQSIDTRLEYVWYMLQTSLVRKLSTGCVGKPAQNLVALTAEHV